MKIDFPPFLCNRKCPRKTKKGYTLYPQSYISIPPGTKLEIFLPEDPDDPSSDCGMVEVIVTNKHHTQAVMVDRLSTQTT